MIKSKLPGLPKSIVLPSSGKWKGVFVSDFVAYRAKRGSGAYFYPIAQRKEAVGPAFWVLQSGKRKWLQLNETACKEERGPTGWAIEDSGRGKLTNVNMDIFSLHASI